MNVSQPPTIAALDTGTPHADQRVAVKSIFAFWAFYFLLNTAHMAIEAQPDQLGMVLRRCGVIVAGIGLTFIMYLILRRLENRSMRFMVTTTFLISIPVSIAYAFVNYTAFYLVAPTNSIMQEMAQMHAKHEGLASVISDSAISWYFFIAAWGVLYVALSYAARVRHAERTAAVYCSQAQAAQLRALRYQINPHFLFNTLNSLSTLVLRQRTQDAERMITSLATFFRTSLASDPEADVPLCDEIDMQRLYLDIERIRFPERLSVVIDVPEDLGSARVPGLILQPLVENAVKHGVARSSRPVTIAIRASADGGAIHLSVEDDADNNGAANRRGEGVGLRNVRDRLLARFDGAADANYGPRDGGGFRVDLKMPLLRDG
jgi:two-component system LytT family sensor kinase